MLSVPSASPIAAPSLSDAVEPLRRLIDQRLGALLAAPADATDTVAHAVRDGVLAPGKRIRPLLMLLTARGLGHDAHPGVLDLACAVEMVHAASLFLDDLPCMDDAQLRRGRPTLHVRYGEDVAVLGAVALLSHAWRVVALADGLPAEVRTRLVVVLSDAVGLQGLVRGQFRDLREGAATDRSLDAIASTNQQKTGSLFSAALEMVALACGADNAVCGALHTVAVELGHAFQLRDDLEDGDDPSGATATKDRHQDDGKATMVAVLGRNAVEQRLRLHLDRVEAELATALPCDSGAAALVRAAFGPACDGAALPSPLPAVHDRNSAGASVNRRAWA